jgi:hypothetical protein
VPIAPSEHQDALLERAVQGGEAGGSGRDRLVHAYPEKEKTRRQ